MVEAGEVEVETGEAEGETGEVEVDTGAVGGKRGEAEVETGEAEVETTEARGDPEQARRRQGMAGGRVWGCKGATSRWIPHPKTLHSKHMERTSLQSLGSHCFRLQVD